VDYSQFIFSPSIAFRAVSLDQALIQRIHDSLQRFLRHERHKMLFTEEELRAGKVRDEVKIQFLFLHIHDSDNQAYLEYVQKAREEHFCMISLLILEDEDRARYDLFNSETNIQEVIFRSELFDSKFVDILYRNLKFLKNMEVNLHKVEKLGSVSIPNNLELKEIKSALDHMVQGVLITNRHLQVTHTNESAAYMLGRSRSEMDTLDILELLKVKKESELQRSMDLDIVGRNKRVFKANVRFTEYLNDDFEVVGNIFIITDLTERLQAEEKAKEMARAFGVVEMAGAAAHEINQPLQVISMLAEFLTMQYEEDDPNYKQLSDIHDQCRRISKITTNIQKIAHRGHFATKDYLPGEKIIDIFSVDDSEQENA